MRKRFELQRPKVKIKAIQCCDQIGNKEQRKITEFYRDENLHSKTSK